MNANEQRIAIAEAMGIRVTPEGIYKDSRFFGRGMAEVTTMLPDYLHDLNAMHEAEKALNDEQWNCYLNFLQRLEYDPRFPFRHFVHATASQRAEAFLRCLNLWKE